MTGASLPDQWLTIQLAKLTRALDDVLDLEAGLRDTQLPGQRNKLSQALDEVLDIEAGLNAILPPAAQPSPTHEQPTTQDADAPALALTAYIRRLTERPWPVRLTMRTRLPHRELALVNHAVLFRSLKKVDNPDLEVALDAARNLARHLANTLHRIGGFTGLGQRPSVRAVAEGLALTLDHARVLAYDRAPLLARRLVQATTVAITIAGHREFVRGSHDLDRAIELVQDLVDDLDRHYKPDLEATLIRARDVAHELAKAHDLAEALDQDLRCGRAFGFDEPFAMALADALDQLNQATTDFTGADLASVDLVGVPLQGLRWSSTTRWPPGWEDQIRQASVQLEADLYEIRDDPRIRSHLT